MEVTLKPYELAMAATVGVRRQIASLSSGRKPGQEFDGDFWRVHIEGAAGELAAAKALGRYWDGSVDTFRAADIGPNIQVRTRSNSDYDLIVRDGDSDDAFFVLVVGSMGRYRVVGWIQGRDAKNDKWLRTHGGRPPAYFVPQSELTPFKGRKNG